MKITIFLLTLLLGLNACDENRHFEKNIDFEDRYWPIQRQPSFEFEIADTDRTYNLYVTLRNESDYPHSNLYFTYYLSDSTGTEMKHDLISKFLFDQKTGQPLGKSGLGDIYNHRFPLLEHFAFQHPGKYTVRFEQFMRTDTLRGILSVGLRVEKSGLQ